MSGCERIECGICFKIMRSDQLIKHMKQHENKRYKCIECSRLFASRQWVKKHTLNIHKKTAICIPVLTDVECDQTNNGKRHDLKKHTENKPHEKSTPVLNKHKCIYCNYTSDRPRNVKRHVMKKHYKNSPPPIAEDKEKEEYNSTLDMVALRNRLRNNSNEYMRKLELGRGIKEIVLKLNASTAGLSKEYAEALELFEKHEQVKDVKPVEWRPWQKGLLEYLDNPTDRRIIWVVGGKGNEGKTFFVDKIEEKYGEHRVCEIGLDVPTWYIFEDKEGDVDVAQDILLFDISKSVDMQRINYGLLENIKDGKANVVTGDDVKMVRFTTPNVIMIFSHEYPDTGKLSSVRWMIFKISSGMQLKDVTEAWVKKERDEVKRNSW